MSGTVNLGRRKQIGDYVGQVVHTLRQYTEPKDIRSPSEEDYKSRCTEDEYEILRRFGVLHSAIRPRIEPFLSIEDFNNLASEWEKRVLILEDVPAIEALVGECQAKLMEIQRTAPQEYRRW